MVRVDKPDNVTGPAIKADAPAAAKPKVLELAPTLSVRQLAEIVGVEAIDIIKQLMRAGVMANINQVVNYEAAATVARNLGFEPRLKSRAARKAAEARPRPPRLEGEPNLQSRPPVVTVMGHVDHGKTRTLDAIRQTNVMDSEAGGITQHIGAYQVTYNDQKITFLDTPGHEAFTAMRAHGAQITDITVLVVAADDGVMPQTLEAISHAKAAGVPIVVAINKIDKPGANPDLVKQQLAEKAGLVVEDWGGDTVSVKISAKEKIGITDLLENILVVVEMLELKADPTRPAVGVVIEAKMDKSRGPLATVLVQNGTLLLGDTIAVGNTWGRVKAMFNHLGKRIKKAEPSTPVEILGLNIVPEVGDTLQAVADEREAQALLEKRRQETEAAQGKGVSLDNLYEQISAGKVKELNLVLKTDVQGSIEPIRTSIERLATEKVKVRIIHAGTGNVTESDVMLAIASNGLITGFGVTADEGAKRLAHAKGIDMRFYRIIYDLINDVDKALKGLLEPTYTEVIDGRAEVRAVFGAAKSAKAAGGSVVEGKLIRGTNARVKRGKEKVAEGTITSLRRFKDDVKEIAAGFEFGLTIKGFNNFQVGDIIETYHMERAS